MEQGSKPVERRRPSLSAYITYLLGSGSSNQLKNWFERSWGARSFADFWRFFNPVYGYYLSYYAYRPLRRVAPERSRCGLRSSPPASCSTTLSGGRSAGGSASPEMTLVFALLGLGALASDALHMDMSRWPFVARAGANIAYIVVCFLIVTQLLLRWLNGTPNVTPR
jgi:hypothetical protein